MTREMKRATRNPSQVFQQVLKQAEEQLLLVAKVAANFRHRGVRGDERASAVDQLLSSHLPNTFATGKGEAIDYRDEREYSAGAARKTVREGKVHRDFTLDGKARFHRFIKQHAMHGDMAKVIETLQALRCYVGLS